jgi:hypothetical protein
VDVREFEILISVPSQENLKMAKSVSAFDFMSQRL